MKTMLNALVLTLLLFSASSPCFALMAITHVSKERAKEFGVEIRSKANGPNGVWVELEFKTEGQLKDFNPDRFSRVELQITDGEKSLMTAALQILSSTLKCNNGSIGNAGIYPIEGISDSMQSP